MLFGAPPSSNTCKYNIANLNFGTKTATYKQLQIADNDWIYTTKGTLARDTSQDVAYLMVTYKPKTFFLSIKASDLTLISDGSKYAAGWEYPVQMLIAGIKVFMVWYKSGYSLWMYNTSTKTFTSFYSTSKKIFDLAYDKISGMMSIIIPGSSNSIPQINTYAPDYALLDIDILILFRRWIIDYNYL